VKEAEISIMFDTVKPTECDHVTLNPKHTLCNGALGNAPYISRSTMQRL